MNLHGYGLVIFGDRVPPIYLAGSFGLVRPAWIKYTRSAVSTGLLPDDAPSASERRKFELQVGPG